MPPRWVHSKYCTEAKGELCLHTNTLHPLCVGERAHVLEQYVNQIDPRDLPEFAPFPPFQNTPRYYYTEAKGQRWIVLAHKHITPIVWGERAHVLEQYVNQIDPRDRNKPYELFNKNANSSPKHATLDGIYHLQLGK